MIIKSLIIAAVALVLLLSAFGAGSRYRTGVDEATFRVKWEDRSERDEELSAARTRHEDDAVAAARVACAGPEVQLPIAPVPAAECAPPGTVTEFVIQKKFMTCVPWWDVVTQRDIKTCR